MEHYAPQMIRQVEVTKTKSLISNSYKSSCSTQPSMNFFLFINVKMPTVVGILTIMRRKNSILGLSDPTNC